MLKPETIDAVQSEIIKRRLPDDFMSTVTHWYLPLAQHIHAVYRSSKRPIMVSFNGSQGSGKSTLTAFLQLLLGQQFELTSVELSIDDFYLPRAEREQLALEVHPLLATRGVPGTHDVMLAKHTLDCLRDCSAQHSCRLPRFDKAIDDRAEVSSWPVVDQPVQVILFEGWCNHAPVQSPQQLKQAVNDLEREEDAQGIWRDYANRQLALYHLLLFDRADMLVLLQAPGFEKVYEWRGLQEKKLAEDSSASHKGVMNKQQLRRFIQHYERITRHALEVLPALADVVLTLNGRHAIEAIRFREPADD